MQTDYIYNTLIRLKISIVKRIKRQCFEKRLTCADQASYNVSSSSTLSMRATNPVPNTNEKQQCGHVKSQYHKAHYESEVRSRLYVTPGLRI